MNQSLWFSGDSIDKNERPQDKLYDGISVDALGTLEFKAKDMNDIQFSEMANNLFSFARDILEIQKKAQAWYEVNASFSEDGGLSDDVENDLEMAKKSNGVALQKTG